jgi:hypothetical protein
MASSTSIQAGMPGSPGSRMCCLFVPADRPVATLFFGGFISAIVELSQVRHKYGFGGKLSLLNLPFTAERLGFMYTCAGGLIDMGHLGDTIDLVWYFYQQMLPSPVTLGNNRGDVFSFKSPPTDPATLIAIAQSIAVDLGIRHEIESYFIHSPGQHNSSFSPEDLVSNFVGAYAGAQAIKAIVGPSGGNFDDAAAAAAKDVLTQLGAQDRAGTQAAFDTIEPLWFSAGKSTDDDWLKRRNFSYNPIVPWTYAISGCAGAAPWPSSIPQKIDPQIQSYYEIAFGTNYDDPADAKAVQAGVGGTSFKNSDFPALIQKISADSQSHGEIDQPN